MLLDAQTHTTTVLCLSLRSKYVSAIFSTMNCFLDTHQNGSDFGAINDQTNESVGIAKLIPHVDYIGVVFRKVDSNTHLGITVPSSETFVGGKLFTRPYFAT